MRPRLHENTTYIPVPDGIYFRSNRASLKFRGKNLASFFQLLVPSLNGQRTLEEIVQGLSAEKQTLIAKFLEALLKFDFLRDMSQEQSLTLTQEELATYASQVAFIDSFQNSAAVRFASLRDKRLLLIGSGQSFAALVHACTQSGVKQIDIISTSECGTIADVQQDLRELFPPYDSEQRIQAIGAPRWDDESAVLNTILTYDALLHVSDRPMLARAQMLNRLCIERQKTLIQAIVLDDHAWIGPLVSSGTGACWECAWRRLQANAESPQSVALQDYVTAPISQPCTLSAATMIASRLMFEVFKHFTQTRQKEERAIAGLVDVHLTSFLSSYHEFLPHPLCRACQRPDAPTATQFLSQVQQLQQQPPLDPAIVSNDLASGVDEQLGLFTAFTMGDFVQVPLAVYRVSLSDPMRLHSGCKPLQAIGVDIEKGSARVRAWQRACARYASRLVDQRRLLSHATIQSQNAAIVPIDHLLEGASSLKDAETWTWVLNLHTQQPGLIPAPLVFTALQQSSLAIEEEERGIGSGMSWAEAVCQAVFDWGTSLALEKMRDAQQRYARIDLARVPMTAEGAHLLRLLQSVGAQITVYDVTGALSIPTLAVCVGKNVVAYSTHCDVAHALHDGLRRAMQQQQSVQAKQPAYAVDAVPDIPLALRDDRWSELAYEIVPEAWIVRQEWLLQTLQAHNMQAWACPLNHDPALAQMFPHIVRVLLTRV